MKTTLSLVLILFTTLLATANIAYDKNRMPNPNVTKAFKAKFPTAKQIEWKMKQNYYVAEFYVGKIETDAWFNQDGTWQMTESDLSYNGLPETIKTSFVTSEYATWKVEDVKKVERVGMETMYIVEIEKGEEDIDLYYTENGILLKGVPHEMQERLPEALPQDILTFIRQKYPQAMIIEIDREKGMLEVEIFDQKIKKEVLFDTNNQWQTTTWEVRKSNVPANIMNALKNSQYKSYRIDDIYFQQKNNNTEVYIFDLEDGDHDIKISIDAKSGNIH